MIILQRICVHRKSIVNLGFLGSPNRCIDPRETCLLRSLPWRSWTPWSWQRRRAGLFNIERDGFWGSRDGSHGDFSTFFNMCSHVNHEKDATVGWWFKGKMILPGFLMMIIHYTHKRDSRIQYSLTNIVGWDMGIFNGSCQQVFRRNVSTFIYIAEIVLWTYLQLKLWPRVGAKGTLWWCGFMWIQAAFTDLTTHLRKRTFDQKVHPFRD